MTEGLGALLGCVQGQVSQLDFSGRSRPQAVRLTERVVLPLPDEGGHVVSLVCRHCQQTLRVHVESRRGIRRKRLLTRLALGVSVCAWSAAAALVLLYFLTSFPQAPGGEVALAGFLIAVGVVVWMAVDGYDAFGGDVAIGCRVERSEEERAVARQLSSEARAALPRHELLDVAEAHELSPARFPSHAGAAPGRRKPSASSTVVTPVPLGEARASHSSRMA